MKKNMGKADQIIRIIIAIVLATLYFANIITGIFGVILFLISIIFLITSMFSFCPLYLLFGMNTCKFDKSE